MNYDLLDKLFFCKKCNSDLHFYNSNNLTKEKNIIKCEKCNFKIKSQYGVFDFNLKSNYTKKSYDKIWERVGYFEAKTNYYNKEKILINSSKELFKNKIILEAGVGDGRHLDLLIKNKPSCIVCIDAFDSIYLARKRYDNMGININIVFIKDDLLDSPIKSKSIDTIWSIGVLSVVKSPINYLKSLDNFTKDIIILGTLSDNIYGKIYYSINHIRFIFYFLKNNNLLWIITIPSSLIFYLLFILIIRFFFPNNYLIKNIRSKNFINSIKNINGLLQEPLLVPRIKKSKNKYLIDLMQELDYRSIFYGEELFLKYFIFSKN